MCSLETVRKNGYDLDSSLHPYDIAAYLRRAVLLITQNFEFDPE